MPKMYTYNTSASPIKERYAMIGSTATQVKKRYAMIGSTATLIFGAEEYLLQNGIVTDLAGGFTHHKQQYNSELVFDNGYMILKNTNSGSQSRYDTNNPIDWSRYTKLYIQMGATKISGSSKIFIAIDNGATLSSTIVNSTTSDKYTLLFSDIDGVDDWGEDYVLEIDISNITTTGKLMFQLTSNLVTWNIKNIWVE